MGFGEFVLRLAESGSLPIVSAFLIGLLAAISPCPLATNITAMAYISRTIANRKQVAVSGALYTLGRMTSYFTIGALVMLAGLAIPRVSLLLQSAGERFLGPLLIVVGIIMLGVIKLPFFRGTSRLTSLGERVARWGSGGAFLLGVVFALAFCPYTAIMFFGVLIPLALVSTGGIALPAVFAVGTGLPVLVFSLVLAAGVARVAALLDRVTAAEKVIRRIAALVFIAVGIYYVILWIRA